MVRMISLCNHLDYFLRHHSTDDARAWIELKAECPVYILNYLIEGCLVWLESVVPFVQ